MLGGVWGEFAPAVGGLRVGLIGEGCMLGENVGQGGDDLDWRGGVQGEGVDQWRIRDRRSARAGRGRRPGATQFESSILLGLE